MSSGFAGNRLAFLSVSKLRSFPEKLFGCSVVGLTGTDILGTCISTCRAPSPGGQTTHPRVSVLAPLWAAPAPRGDRSAALLAGAAAVCVGGAGEDGGALCPHGLRSCLPRARLSVCEKRLPRRGSPTPCFLTPALSRLVFGVRGTRPCSLSTLELPFRVLRIPVTCPDCVFKPNIFVTMVFYLP